MANVYFSNNIGKNGIISVLKPFMNKIKSNEKVILKVHFGEKGNTRFVSPEYVKVIADLVSERKGCSEGIFISDCNTLYKGMRSTGANHKNLAEEHGFSMGYPRVIGDGELGDEEYKVEIGKKHFKDVFIGRFYKDADVIIAISHFKGHGLTGYGGAVKNLGMGMGSRRGKLAMHSKVLPEINQSKCSGCGKCVEICDVNAVQLTEGKAIIDTNKCIGCAMCINVCPTGAAAVPWGGATSKEVIERTAEYALGAVKGKKIICINFINNITKECDCFSDTEIIAEDIGITASEDPVSIDKASFDLVVKQNGKDVFKEVNGVESSHIVEYAEGIGLGEAKYELVE